MNYFPKDNIAWNKIPENATVALVISATGTQWWIIEIPGRKPAVPYWSGHEAAHAQQYLAGKQSKVIDLRRKS